MQTPQSIVVKHTSTGGVTSIYTGVAAPEQNAFVDPRRPAKAFFFIRNDKKVYGSDLCQHKKHISNLLINRVKSNEM